MNRSISASSIALELVAVSKSFGATRAVDAVDLAAADGELLVLVGPSGCGKSTLLRVVAGLAAADRGTVHIGATLVDDGRRRADPEQRDVGLVFQEHNLFPHLTVGENVMFGLHRLPRSERIARRDDWLAMVGLPDTVDRYPHELSGGERQRVALVRALAPRPRLMLLDEPFASLDPNLRAQLRAEVVSILHHAGTAAVIVTHDQSEALAVGDRIAVMRAGRIEQLATPDDVFLRPANQFVAGFMGDANLLAIDAHGLTELGPAVTERRPVAGELLVVRPTDVVVHIDGDAIGEAPKAQVVSAEFRGVVRSYVLRLPSGTMVTSTQPHTVVLTVGSTVQVSIGDGPHATVPAGS